MEKANTEQVGPWQPATAWLRWEQLRQGKAFFCLFECYCFEIDLLSPVSNS